MELLKAIGFVKRGKNRKEILKYVNKTASRGDLLITLGAGDVYKIAELFLRGEI